MVHQVDVNCKNEFVSGQLDADAVFATMTSWLWRGGTVANWFVATPQAGDRDDVKRTIWFDTDKPKQAPKGKTNVYFGLAPLTQIPPTNADGEPTPPQYVRSQYKYLEAINCLFAEYDRKDYPQGALPHILALAWQPTVLIESSPGSYHAYWFLRDTIKLDGEHGEVTERARAAQYGWVNAVGGDKGAKDLTRVLRVPGRPNVKKRYAPNYPIVSVVWAEFDRIYDFDELERVALAALSAAEKVRAERAKSGSAVVVEFGGVGDVPDVSDLPDNLVAMLNTPVEEGKRSGRDYHVCIELARLGKTDDYIRDIFYHFPVGRQGKFAKRGENYLARTIARAREAIPDPALGTGTPVGELLTFARKWVAGADAVEYLRERGVKRAADSVKVLAALVQCAVDVHSLVVTPGLRQVAIYANVNTETARRQLEKMADAGVIEMEKTDAGFKFELSFVILAVRKCDSIHSDISVALTHSEKWQESNLQSDLFTALPYRYGIKRRTVPSVLIQSLGASALLVWRALLDAPSATAQELADTTGLSVDGAKRALRKMEAAGVVVVVGAHGQRHVKVWALVDAADDRAVEILPVVTSYGTGMRNAELNDRLRAGYFEEKAATLEQAVRAGTAEPGTELAIAKLESKAETLRHIADVRVADMLAQGIKPKKHWRQTVDTRWDKAEQEIEEAAAIVEWGKLGDISKGEKARIMAGAGWSSSDINAAIKASHRGTVAQQVVDADEDAAQDAAQAQYAADVAAMLAEAARADWRSAYKQVVTLGGNTFLVQDNAGWYHVDANGVPVFAGVAA